MTTKDSLQPTEKSNSISNPSNKYYRESKMNSTKGSPLGTNKKTTKIDMKMLLSSLWIVATLNYMYADVMALMDAEILADLINGTAGGGIQVSEGLLLGAAIFMEIPIVMILLSLVLKYRANRWANISIGTIKTVAILSSMFFGPHPSLYYMFFGTVETVCTSLIVWYAWKWSEQEAKEPVRKLMAKVS